MGPLTTTTSDLSLHDGVMNQPDLDLTPHGVTKALNQLASVLAGKELAIATNDLDDQPIARIETMIETAQSDLMTAGQLGDSKLLGQSQRKLQSLISLLTLAKS